MKTYSVALLGELARSVARLATCMRIERRDGNVYGFTTARKPGTIDGVLYLPAASFNPSDIAAGLDLDPDDVQVEGLLASATITEDDLRATRWDYAEFRIFQVNWADLTQGEKKDRRGHLGKCEVNRDTFVAELLGLMEAYGTSIGELTQPQCLANLGDQRCKVDLVGGSPSLTVTGTVATADADFFTLHFSDRSEPDDYFDEGVITLAYPSGTLRYEVKQYLLDTGSPPVATLTTKTAMAYDATGVAYSMHRGCRKRFIEDCRDTFNNVNNFRGQPWLRGQDALLQIGRHGVEDAPAAPGTPPTVPPPEPAPGTVDLVLAWDGSNSPYHTSGVVIGDTYVVEFTTDASPVGPGNVSVAEYGDPPTRRDCVISTDVAGTSVVASQSGNTVNFIFGSAPGQVWLTTFSRYFLLINMPTGTPGDPANMVITF